MDKKERKRIMTSAIHEYGEESQIKMMIEEMSELTKAICKFWRTEPGSFNRKIVVTEIAEEMADVQIVLDQMKIIFGNTRTIEDMKLDRLRDRVERKEECGILSIYY